MEGLEGTEIEVEARDGRRLAGTRFAPASLTGPTTLLLPAMGVPRGFYEPFARHLAGEGHRVLSLDYRGVGGSTPGTLRGFEARLTEWATLDVAGLIDHALAEHDPERLVVAGHSVAGQILGLVPSKQEIERALVVASVKGHWRMWNGHRAAWLWTLSHLVVPLLVRTLGYLPARRIGLGGEDLPAGVAAEWARWIRHPDYVVDEDGRHPAEAFAGYEGDLLGISLADDWYAPACAVEALLEMYPNAPSRHREIEPREAGVEEIGHFGFFRPRCRRLWDAAAGWLEAAEEDTPTAAFRESA